MDEDTSANYDDYIQKENFRSIMTAIIQKQMELIGFHLGLSKARNITELSLNDHGTVMTYYGNPNEIITKLLNQYYQLTGEAAYYFSKKAVEQLIKVKPEIALPQSLQNYKPSTEFTATLNPTHESR